MRRDWLAADPELIPVSVTFSVVVPCGMLMFAMAPMVGGTLALMPDATGFVTDIVKVCSVTVDSAIFDTVTVIADVPMALTAGENTKEPV